MTGLANHHNIPRSGHLSSKIVICTVFTLGNARLLFYVWCSVCMFLPQSCICWSLTWGIYTSPLNTHVPNWFPQTTALVPVGLWMGQSQGICRASVCRQWFNSWQTDWQFPLHEPKGPKTSGACEQENVVVDASCHITWEEYEATTGQSMPAGALIGGLLAATNTPLYLSRQETSKCNWDLG